MNWLTILLFLNILLFGYNLLVSSTLMIIQVGLIVTYLVVHFFVKNQIEKMESRKRRTSTDEKAIEKLGYFIISWNILFVGLAGFQVMDTLGASIDYRKDPLVFVGLKQEW